jgi:hypothetical protein
LDKNLIQTHLDIFEQLQPLFTKFLETRERVNPDTRDYKAILKRKDVPLPTRLTLDAWK